MRFVHILYVGIEGHSIKVKENQKIQHIFKRYLDGTATPAETAILMEYLSENENNDADFFPVMEEAWLNQNSTTPSASLSKGDFEALRHKIEAKNYPEDKRKFCGLKYAASVVVILSAALGWLFYQKTKNKQQEQVSFYTKSTQKGQKIKLILPDSSVVYLASESKLTYPSHFIKGKKRSIYLAGEAFFEVKRDTSSPFVVHSGKLQTTVLGTSFNIYAYPNETTESVTVRTGKVQVAAVQKRKVKPLSLLMPGNKIKYDISSNHYVVSQQEVESANGWVENHFVFKNEKLTDMLRYLARYYAVDFDLKHRKFAQYRFSATFKQKSISEIMAQIKLMSSNKLNYKIDKMKNKITIWENNNVE